jgi:hypothetical protein
MDHKLLHGVAARAVNIRDLRAHELIDIRPGADDPVEPQHGVRVRKLALLELPGVDVRARRSENTARTA